MHEVLKTGTAGPQFRENHVDILDILFSFIYNMYSACQTLCIAPFSSLPTYKTRFFSKISKMESVDNLVISDKFGKW